MRKALGRLALLLGVIVVAAAAWWGAVALFEGDGSDDDGSAPDVECVAAATRADVRAARRAFVGRYGDAAWFGRADIKRTADGFVLQVTYRKDRPPAELPACQADVLVVAVRGRSPEAN